MSNIIHIYPTQDPEYGIKDNRIVEGANGVAIPSHEPIFILRARDRRSLPAIYEYLKQSKNPEYLQFESGRVSLAYVEYSVDLFEKYAINNQSPDKVPNIAPDSKNR